MRLLRQTHLAEWRTYQDERMNHPNFLPFILVAPATRMSTRMKQKNSREKRENFRAILRGRLDQDETRMKG